jgi:hypothetical protein
MRAGSTHRVEDTVDIANYDVDAIDRDLAHASGGNIRSETSTFEWHNEAR